MKIPSESDLMTAFPNEGIQYLYHYTAFSSAVKILLSHQIRLGSLKNMNDPLEFENHHGVPLMYEEERSEKEYQKKIRDYEKAVTEKENYVRIASFSRDISPSYTLLSNGWARSRMWAQYANNHKGVCLIFDKKKLILNFELRFKNDACRTYCREVNYTNILQPLGDALSLPCKSLLTEDKIKFLFQKCEDFRDEQEFRLLLINKDLKDANEIASFPISDSICGIITGAKFPDEDKIVLKKAVECCNPSIKIFPIWWHYGMPGLWKDD